MMERKDEFNIPTPEECEITLRVLATVQNETLKFSSWSRGIDEAVNAIGYYMNQHKLWR